MNGHRRFTGSRRYLDGLGLKRSAPPVLHKQGARAEGMFVNEVMK